MKAQSPLSQCAFLLSASLSHGLDEAPRSTRSSRQARQVQQRIAFKDQGAMFPNAYASPYAISIETQRPFTVLVESFRCSSVRVGSATVNRGHVASAMAG
jgi:hypothetical protein